MMAISSGVFLFENVILSGGDEREAFGGVAGGPLVPVEPVHQVAGDAVFLQQHDDGLRGVVRIFLAWKKAPAIR